MLRSFNCCSIVAFKDDQAGAKTSAVAFWIFDDLRRSLSSQSRRRGEGGGVACWSFEEIAKKAVPCSLEAVSATVLHT